jgi:hypothetical protein
VSGFFRTRATYLDRDAVHADLLGRAALIRWRLSICNAAQ